MTAQTTHAIVELLEPVRWAGVEYAAGHQFVRLRMTACTSFCRDFENRPVRVRNRLLVVVKPADPDPDPEPATLAAIIRSGRVRPALELLQAAG